MNKVLKRKNSYSRLGAIEEIFFDYAKKHQDSKANVLVEAILDESEHALEHPREWWSGDYIWSFRALKALELQSKIPTFVFVGRHFDILKDHTLTRRKLWDAALMGIVMGTSDKFEKVVHGLLTELNLSSKESEAFKEVCRERLTDLNPETAGRVLESMQAYRGVVSMHNELAYRRLLQAVARYSEIKVVTEMAAKLKR